MDHLCEKTDITLEWEMGDTSSYARNHTPTPLTKATPRRRMTAARVIETLEDTKPSRATERASGVCIHPVQSPLTQRTSKQRGREGRPNRMHICRATSAAFPCEKSGGATLWCAGRGGGDHRIASPLLRVWMLVSARMSSLHAVHRKALSTSLMDGSSRDATADGRSSRLL